MTLIDVILRAIREKDPKLTPTEAKTLMLALIGGMDPSDAVEALKAVRDEIAKRIGEAPVPLPEPDRPSQGREPDMVVRS